MEWFPGVVFQELVIHEWDIRSTLEPSPPVSEDSLPCLMERASNRRRPWTILFLTSATSSGPIRYRFKLAAGGRRDVAFEGLEARSMKNLRTSVILNVVGLVLSGLGFAMLIAAFPRGQGV